VRLAVDAERCTGHGRCYTVAPDLLTYDDEGYVSIRGSAVEVPDDQVAAARDAASSCPEQAIQLLPANATQGATP
jgi:ferredoxin